MSFRFPESVDPEQTRYAAVVGRTTYDVARTTKKVDGNWAGNPLKLEHRGGVTYTGTFKLPGSGGSSEVKCNDLAMFD